MQSLRINAFFAAAIPAAAAMQAATAASPLAVLAMAGALGFLASAAARR